MKLSIVIPAYNEISRISKTLEDYMSFFAPRYGEEFEIIVVLNGCRDGTLNIVQLYAKMCKQIKYLDFEQAGKGFAIMEGFKVAEGELIGFTDADDSTDAKNFNDLIENLGVEDFDGIIGSRYLEGSIVEPKQSAKRIFFSRAFNLLIKLLFSMNYKDTQCGAKVFRKNAIKTVLPDLGTVQWAFDIDLLYQMKRNNFNIKEFAITWRDAEYSTLNIWQAGPNMFFALIKLRLMHLPKISM